MANYYPFVLEPMLSISLSSASPLLMFPFSSPFFWPSSRAWLCWPKRIKLLKSPLVVWAFRFVDALSLFQLKWSCLSAGGGHHSVSVELLPLPAGLGTQICWAKRRVAKSVALPRPIAVVALGGVSATPAPFGWAWPSGEAPMLEQCVRSMWPQQQQHPLLKRWHGQLGEQRDIMEPLPLAQGLGSVLLLSRPHLVCVTVRVKVARHISSRGWILIRCLLVSGHRGFFCLCQSWANIGLCIRYYAYLFLNSCLPPLLKSICVLLLWLSTCVSGTVHFYQECFARQASILLQTWPFLWPSPLPQIEIIIVTVSIYCRNNWAHWHLLIGQISEYHSADPTVASGLTSRSLPAG